jgi:hypothetical protein
MESFVFGIFKGLEALNVELRLRFIFYHFIVEKSIYRVMARRMGTSGDFKIP